MTCWYLYQNKEGHRWWSDFPSCYQPEYKLVALQESIERPTDTAVEQRLIEPFIHGRREP